jgi:tetratricopeptide (TPR) repeat protein
MKPDPCEQPSIGIALPRPAHHRYCSVVQRGDVIAGRFEIERLAGSGGTSEVYRAIDRTTGEVVALKRLLGPQRARFDLEARVLSQIDHPAVVRYVAHGTEPRGERWLAMEWLEGEALSARLARHPLSVRETAAFGFQVADALGAAHARGIVHRDIKPENLFLAGGEIERVKLLDFGIVRVGRLPRDTRAGMVLGTLGYMAPEQARGAAAIDARADVFALGCVLLECLTGKPVFSGDDLMSLLAKIVIDDVPRASSLRARVPDALDDLVARMTAKDPALRPPDGAAVAAELAAIASSEGAPRSRASAPHPELTRGERRVVSVVLVSGVGDVPLDVLRAVVAARHGCLEPLADGSLAAALSGSGIAEDRAAQAAQCALALRTLLPECPTALAMGWSEGRGEGGRPTSEVVDRAARLVRAIRRLPEAQRADAGILVDEVSAALLDRRFDLREGPAGTGLHGERPAIEGPRTLLGRPSACVGRERELDALAAIFERAVAGPGARAALITAPAGFGKSRVGHETVERLRDRAQIWLGRGDPSSAGSAFSVLAAAIRHAAGLEGGDPLPLRREKLRGVVRAGVPEPDRARVAAFLGEIVGAPFADSAAPELAAARRDAALMGGEMRRAWVELARAACARGPVVLVLDDLHWGDLPTVQLVDAALAALRDAPLLVVGLGRPEVHELFPRLWADHDVTELRLGGLGPEAALRLVREALGDGADAARLVEQADGHPLYLEELVRAAAHGAGEKLPETVLAMVETRLERLDPEARRALRAASVFGETFWRGSVAALFGSVEEAGRRLAELVEQELVSRRAGRRFAGEEEFAFRHALVREAAYAMLTEKDRRLGHQLAGEWLEHAGETDAMVLAGHFEGGEDPARAVGWYLRAAEQALEGNDLDAVLARAGRGVACGAEGEALGTLELFRAEASRWRGDPAAAERHGAEAMARLLPGGPLWFGAAREVILAARDERLTPVILLVRAQPRDESIAGAQLGPLAAAYGRLLAAGRRAEAAEILPAIEAFADLGAARDPAAAAAIHDARARNALEAGDVAAFLRAAEASRASFERAGDLRSACARRLEIGRAHALVGAYAEAERAQRAVLPEAARLGLTALEAEGRQHLGLTLARLGRLEEARAAAMTAAAVFAAGGEGARVHHGAARATLATILLLLGEETGPEREARAAVEASRGTTGAEASALVALAEVLLAERRTDEALEAARAALGLLSPGRDHAAGSSRFEGTEARARLVHVEALAAAGDRAAARAALEEARDRLFARAAVIGDPALRTSFLEGVPENARTLDLARLAGIPARVPPGPSSSLRRAPASSGPESEASASLREARRALERGNPEAAIARVEQGMNHVAPGEVRAELRAVMARAHGWRNAWTPASRWAEQGMREVSPGSRGWYAALTARLLAATQLGSRDEIIAAADALPRLGADGRAADAHVIALAALGIALAPLGEKGRAEECFDRMERAGAAVAARVPLVRGWMSRARAERARSIEEDPWTALRLDEGARASFGEAGDRGEAALSLALVGIDRWQLGAHERAEEALRAAREAGETQGSRADSTTARPVFRPPGYLVALTSIYIAWTLADAGRLVEAGAEILAGLKAERSRHNPSLKAAASGVLAEILRRRGELEAAEREVDAALAVPGVSPLGRTAALATLASIRIQRGRAAQGLELSRKARAEREALRVFGFRDTFVRLTHIEALLATGDVSGARAPLSRTYGRLLVHSSKIGDPALRASFLERVPENARIIALARQWLGEVSDHAFR